MTICYGFLYPPVGWTLYWLIVVGLGTGVFFLWRKQELSWWKGTLVVLGYLLLAIFLFGVFAHGVIDVCSGWYTPPPVLVKDYDRQIASLDEALVVCEEILRGEFSSVGASPIADAEERLQRTLSQMRLFDGPPYRCGRLLIYENGEVYKPPIMLP